MLTINKVFFSGLVNPISVTTSLCSRTSFSAHLALPSTKDSPILSGNGWKHSSMGKLFLAIVTILTIERSFTLQFYIYDELHMDFPCPMSNAAAYQWNKAQCGSDSRPSVWSIILIFREGPRASQLITGPTQLSLYKHTTIDAQNITRRWISCSLHGERSL